ncbi:unnamed protein product [Polarella glacialis]|uniref:Uncharacterized protein n=1 Tax=Polarella glacialis TaxID=89957 RepID=A0A813GMS1_POLGL|nr:unnamed protein product [Polarella glacialis]
MVRASPIFGTIYKSLVHLIVECNMGLHVERRTMNTNTNTNNSHGKCESSQMMHWTYKSAVSLDIRVNVLCNNKNKNNNNNHNDNNNNHNNCVSTGVRSIRKNSGLEADLQLKSSTAVTSQLLESQ